MLVYWLMLLVPAFAAVTQPRSTENGRKRRITLGWTAVWLTLTILIGYRYQVGGDWGTYLRNYYTWNDKPLIFAFETGDVGYFALNWLSARLGWGIYGVNIIGAAFFAIGLVVFCRTQTRPWLALLVAIPYLVIVVGMGYTRQAIAIGFAMLGLVALTERNNLKFAAWVLLGALFHKSAVVLLPLAILVARQGRWWTGLWLGATLLLLYFLWLDDVAQSYLRIYVDTQMESQGAAVRIAMNAVPAVVFLMAARRLHLDDQTYRLWTCMGLLALGAVVWLAVSPSSTAVDRIALFMIPLQLFVFSRLPDLAGSDRQARYVFIIGTVAYAVMVQAVWLNYALHARYWLPYQFYPTLAL